MSDALWQLLHSAERAAGAIFGFIATLWNWSVLQISELASVPWQAWPLWKQVVLAIIAAAILFLLFKIVLEFVSIGSRLLEAFLRAIPLVAIAGLLALGGLWVLTSIDLSGLRLPVAWQSSPDQPIRR